MYDMCLTHSGTVYKICKDTQTNILSDDGQLQNRADLKSDELRQ